MFPLRVIWPSTRRLTSVSTTQPNSLDSFISKLARTHVSERSSKSSIELEKLIDDKKASADDRLDYIIKLPSLVNKQQLNRIRDDTFASDFSLSSLNTIDLIAGIDKICKLRATDTQVYRSLMNVLASTSITLLRNANICALVEVVASNEDLKAIDDEKWRRDAVKVVAELIKDSSTHTDVIFALRRSSLWKNECIQAIKSNLKNMGFADKVSLLSTLSERDDIDELFINTMVEDIASDMTLLTPRQCVNLASACISLKLTSNRLKTKLINETMAGMGSMTKWNDVRTIITLFKIWKVSDDEVWRQISVWTGRRAKEVPFKELSAVVNLMGGLGRSEGSKIASILSRRVCLEKGGNALTWLNTVVSLSFYSSVDERSIESVLNPTFIQEVLAHSYGKRARVLRLLLQVDYYASTLDYSGPRLSTSLLTEEDRESIVSSYYTRAEEVQSFRTCLSRVIVDPSQCRPQLHPSGLTIEARFTNPEGNEETVVFLPSDRCAKNGNEERMMGSNLFSIKCMQKKGIKVHSFTYREMELFKSQVEATLFIKKRVIGN